MTDTTPLTAQQLNEMQSDLDRQKATLALAKIAEAFETLEAHEAVDLQASLSEIASAMPDGPARSQLHNISSIIASTTMVLTAERDRHQRVLEPIVQIASPMMPPIIPPAE